MGRRRNSAPSPLILTPPTVPLRRNQPKFTLPSPPSTQAIHLATHHRLKRVGDPNKVVAVREMPRLQLPDGVAVFGGGDQHVPAPGSSGSTASSPSASCGMIREEMNETSSSSSEGRRIQGADGDEKTWVSSSSSGRGRAGSASSTSTTSSSEEDGASVSPGSEGGSTMGGWLRPWSGRDAVLPQIMAW